MYPLVEPRQRPERFLLNRFSPLAESAVFLGLGGFDAAGSVWYPDARRLLGEHPNDGTLTNAAPSVAWTFDATLSRSVLQFIGGVMTDGSNDKVVLPAAMLAGLGQWTVAGWVLLDSLRDDMSPFFGDLAANSSPTMRLDGATGNYEWYAHTGTSFFIYGKPSSSAYYLAASIWAHIGLTFDGTTWVMYWNGLVANTNTATGTLGASPGYCGLGGLNGSAEPWSGRIGDPVACSRALSQAEISALADPSNVMLEVGGVPLILPPRRVAFPAAVAAGGFKPYWLRPSSQIIGGGIAA